MSFVDVDPAEFARVIAQTPDDQLAEGMASENRALVLDGIFDQMEAHLDPERAAGTEAVIDWKIWDRPEGGYDHYRVHIFGGACRVEKDPGDGDARVTFRIKPVHFLKLVTGNASGPQMFVTGKLKIDGDLMFAAQVQSLFEIPKG
jgi:putative sterol carrier protein